MGLTFQSGGSGGVVIKGVVWVSLLTVFQEFSNCLQGKILGVWIFRFDSQKTQI